MRRWSAAAGIVFVVLAFVSRLAEGRAPDPESHNAVAKFASFYASSAHDKRALVAVVVGIIALFAFAWFAGGLWVLLRAAEGVPSAPLIVAAVGAATFVALGITSHVLTDTIGLTLHFAKGYAVGHGFDPATALVMNAAGRGMFLGAMVGAGLFTAGAAVVILRTRALPAWLGWLGIVIAVACLPTIPPVSAIAALLLALWTLAASVLMISHATVRSTA
jgi:hypothetical protein